VLVLNGINKIMRTFLFLAFSLFVKFTVAQEQVEVLLKQADNFDKQVKEAEAIEKYKEVLEADPKNFKALYRLTELNAAIGSRQIKNEVKLPYFTAAMDYAGRAFTVDSSNADSYYLLALTSWKMSSVEEKNKEEIEYLRKWKEYADKAISINASHAKATFLAGKWNFDMAKASLLKKAAAKTIYGGMSKWDIETAIKLFEQAKTLDPYFVQNFYELAKAYEYNNQPTPQIETLNRLIKLPVRTGDDAGWKAEGKKMLEQMK
jgi:tetratricopeptide (TPR) repeat protein